MAQGRGFLLLSPGWEVGSLSLGYNSSMSQVLIFILLGQVNNVKKTNHTTNWWRMVIKKKTFQNSCPVHLSLHHCVFSFI